MDSILIKPKDEKELRYFLELLEKTEVQYRQISQEATDEFELAMMIKDKTINTAGIIRQDTGVSNLSKVKKSMLEQSEQDITDKLIVTELKIQHEEDEWLNQ